MTKKHSFKLTLKFSPITCLPKHLATLRGLGFRRKLNTSVMREDTPAIRGMINQVSYLLKIEKIES
ncbi:MAG: 50S ribosomal protein L30 [Gammaproteobacteria bacterium]